jgi:hypothetical protein
MIYENAHDRRGGGLVFDLIEAPLIDVRQRNEVERPGPAKPVEELFRKEKVRSNPRAPNVTIFFSTMPAAYYDTFKNIMREWPDF